jgi:hypothetical protein
MSEVNGIIVNRLQSEIVVVDDDSQVNSSIGSSKPAGLRCGRQPRSVENTVSSALPAVPGMAARPKRRAAIEASARSRHALQARFMRLGVRREDRRDESSDLGDQARELKPAGRQGLDQRLGLDLVKADGRQALDGGV